MLSERMLSGVIRSVTGKYLHLEPTTETMLPCPKPGQDYMLYIHVPFCETLCPYCSFNRFPYEHNRACTYFDSLRAEMRMVHDLGYSFDSLYIGGGTPTVQLDELLDTVRFARELFGISEVSCETNPNHITSEYVEKLEGNIDRLSVGVQSFDDGLLHQMGRLRKYGTGRQIFELVKEASPHFKSLNVDLIFNFPAQTEELLVNDIAMVLESGVSQATFYPLMASPSVERSLARTVGRVDYSRERRYYHMISQAMTEAGYSFGSCWAFNKYEQNMIDEYVVDYEQYPAIGSGSFSYFGDYLYVNTFSISDYNKAIAEGRMGITGCISFPKHDQMRYRFMMQLFGLRLDKRQFERDFGCSIDVGLPVEMAFMRACRAFAIDNDNELTLTPAGRYLMVVMMRQFFIGVNSLRDQARAALTGPDRELLFEAGILK